MPSSLSHTQTVTHTRMDAYTHTHKNALVHTLTLLWTLLCTHRLYEAEDYPTIGNQTQPYMGLVRIHFGPFRMCVQSSNIEAAAQRGGSPNAPTPSHSRVGRRRSEPCRFPPRLSTCSRRGIPQMRSRPRSNPHRNRSAAASID